MTRDLCQIEQLLADDAQRYPIDIELLWEREDRFRDERIDYSTSTTAPDRARS